MNPDLRAKRLEILHDMAPKLRRIGVLHDPKQSALDETIFLGVEKGANALGKELLFVGVGATDNIDEAFLKLEKWRALALVVLASPFFYNHRKILLERAVKYRLPTVTGTGDYAEAGGLISYGADYADLCRRSAAYAARILKGENPAALPVQQPTKFEFVINLKTAKALGLTIPRQVLLRADRVIE